MDQKLKKQQLVPYFLTKNHLLSSKKHCKICIFRGNLTKPQKNRRFFKNPRKNPRSPNKNPRTLDRVGKPQIWGENPRSGNAEYDVSLIPADVKSRQLATLTYSLDG